MDQVSRRSFLSGGLGAAAAGALFLMGCAKDGQDSGKSAIPAADVQWDHETDVVVVGFGGAGASAAINASDAGANVIIIEHAPEGQEGGNTSASGGGSNTAYARDDNRDFMYANFPDVIKHEEIDSVLEELAGTREWMEAHGAKIAETIYGPAFVFVGGNGYSLFQWLKETAINSPGVQVMYSTPGKRLIFDPVTKEVYGVVAEQNGKLINIKAKRGVVMACGGFEADHYKMTAYLPAGFPFFPAGTPYNTGLGIDMVQEVGAKLRGFGSVEYDCHCCKKGSEEIGVALAHSFQHPQAWRNAIMINGKGKRFVNETFGGRYAEGTITRPLHAKEQIPELALEFTVFEQEGMGKAAGGAGLYTYANLPMYMICGETRISDGEALFRAAGKGAGNHWASLRGLYEWSADNQKEIQKGWIIKADTLDELASKINVPADALKETVAKYEAACAAGGGDEWGRNFDLTPIGDGPFYACELGLGIINTQGGPERDSAHHVIDNNDQIIKRLYAGGEFGSIYVSNYPGALNVPEAMATRVAGTNAANEEPWC